jgi:hypothetical protein
VRQAHRQTVKPRNTDYTRDGVPGMKKDMVVNGINVKQLFSTIDEVKANLEVARFKFRATNVWVEGTNNRATVKDFYGALHEDNTRNPMIFPLDEPPVLCGRNLGPIRLNIYLLPCRDA